MKLIFTCHSTTSWLRTKICQGGDSTDSITRRKGNTQVEYNKEPSCGPEGGEMSLVQTPCPVDTKLPASVP